MAVTADGQSTESIGLLTSDIALKTDPEFYKYVKMFAENMTYLDEEFAHGWYQLVTRDMGPRDRCVGQYSSKCSDLLVRFHLNRPPKTFYIRPPKTPT